MPKTITLTQVGWHVEGIAEVVEYNGNKFTADVLPSYIPLGCMTKEKLYSCINDGKHGCEAIEYAELYVAEVYDYEGSHNSGSYYANWREYQIEDPKVLAKGKRGI